MKNYTLIVGHGFSISNETDYDVQSDYFPGIWGIKTQKKTLEYAKRLISEGNVIRVTDYDNPAYHSLANWFIKSLGLDQTLFTEPEAITQARITNGSPSSLSELKRYLSPGKKIRISNYTAKNERETFVKRCQTSSVVVDKLGSDSWLELGKASEWQFTNEAATHFFIDREGKQSPATTITYIAQ